MFLALQEKKKIFPFCHLELARKHDKSLSLFASNKKVLLTKSCAGEIEEREPPWMNKLYLLSGQGDLIRFKLW